MSWAIDLDGVVWRGDVPIDGSPEAIEHLANNGEEVVYVTNSSSYRSRSYVDKLTRFGIPATTSQIIHGGHAVAQLTKPGMSVLVCAGNGVVEGLEMNEVEVVDPSEIGDTPPPVDAVVIGWIPNYDYRRLALATRAVLAGARLLATNMDPLYPKHDGMTPGTGALASAVAYATGASIEFGGKPQPTMIDLVRERAEDITVFVGDQPATDGRMAEAMGIDFILVFTGVTSEDNGSFDIPVVATAPDLYTAVKEWSFEK